MTLLSRVVNSVAVAATLVAFAPLDVEPAGAQVISFDAGELLGKPTATSITINVVPSQQVSLRVQYGTSPSNYTTTTPTLLASAPGGQGSEVTVTGLSPNTRYYYRVQYNTGDGQWENRPEGTFITQRAPGSSFRFVMQTDAHIVGGPTTNFSTYNSTIANMAADNPDFLIDIGDMFEVTGGSAAVRDSYLLQRSYLEPVSRDAAVYLGIGNHENEEGWFRVSGSQNPIWSINGRKELFANPVPDGFYSGDSADHSGLGVAGDGRRETYYSWEWGDAQFVVLDPFWNTTSRPHDNEAGADPVQTPVSFDNWDWTLGLTQYNWLQQTLSASTKPYKFVFIHQLVGGATTYGRGGGQAVDAGYEWGASAANFAANRPGFNFGSIHSILVNNGVDAVFHGHDHCFATESRGGVVYQEVPMPSAAASNAGFCTQYDSGTPIANSGNVRVDVRPDVAAVSYVGSTGAVQSIYGIDPGNGAFRAIPPLADAGADQTVADNDGNGTQSVSLDGSGSSDLDGTVDLYRWTVGGSQIATGVSPTVNLAVGVHVITLTTTDDDGETDTDTVTVTVTAPPRADAGPDQSVIDGNDNGVQQVTLDGSGSTDPGGSVAGYVWQLNGVQLATGVGPSVSLPLGTHEITLVVTDNDGLTDTDTVVVKVSSPPIMPDPGGGALTVQARYANDVDATGFSGGAGSVSVTFTDPGGGPTCPGFSTSNGGGNPGCDLQPGWTTRATGAGGPAQVTIRDISVVDFDTALETVTVFVDDPGGMLDYGCDGTVAVAYGSDVDDGPTATRMVTRAGRSVIDFTQPGGCAGFFDNTTANVRTGDAVYLTVWDSDGDRTLETRDVAAPFVCPSGATPFGDVSMASFAYDDIACIYGLDLTTGTSPSTYSPADDVTREQMAAFLARVARLFAVNPPGATHPFTDVPTTSFAYQDIALIYTLGVTTGTSPTTYSPNDAVTREQMASFLARLYSVIFGTPSSATLGWIAPHPFNDINPDSFARHDIGRIYGLELTTGTSPTTYSPNQAVTREQMAAFLARLVRLLEFA